VLGWLNALPEALIRTNPHLCVNYAVLLTFTNQLEAAEKLLPEVERRIHEMPAEQAQTIMGWVLSTRAAIAALSGDIETAVALAHQALELLPEKDRGGALVTTIRAYLVSGDVTPAAESEVVAAVTWICTSSHLFAIEISICLLARLHILQGRLRKAAATYTQVMQAVPRPEVLQTMYSSLFYYFSLGDLLREWNDLEAAERNLSQGMALAKGMLTLEPFVAILGFAALARLQLTRGNAREALATLDALVRLAEQRNFSSQWVARGEAVRAQLELAQGNVSAAILWADTSGLSAEDEDLPYSREGEYLVLARVRIAQGRDNPQSPFLQDVLHLLNRLLREAEAKARMGSVLEILVLRALALEALGKRTSAFSTLERALLLAEPEGYIRLFVDEGPLMLALLRQAKARSSVPGYVVTLLSAFEGQYVLDLPLPSVHPGQLAEPLTKRERDVLRLLLAGASNREIARRLVLSVNTVKRHVYNLCGKLGVQNRAQAIVHAKTLNLL